MISILVVENDAKLNQIVCTYLNESGFQVKGCLSAKEAYDEMYHKMIPILFMSAKDDLPSKQKGFRLGIDNYMVKPVELDELLPRVRALLRQANIEIFLFEDALEGRWKQRW